MIYKTMNSRSTSWATLLALAQDQTLDSELFVSQRTPNLFRARTAKPNETEVAWMGLNVSNNCPSISCMQVLTNQGFSGSQQQNRHGVCATNRKTLQDQGAGGMSCKGQPLFPCLLWNQHSWRGCSFTQNHPESSSLLFLHRHSWPAWGQGGFPEPEPSPWLLCYCSK